MTATPDNRPPENSPTANTPSGNTPAGEPTTAPSGQPEDLVYLSDAWLAAADAALADLKPLETELRIGFRVGDGTADDTTHQLVLGPDRVGAERGLDGATVTMTMSWELAVAIAEGRSSAQRAFLDGKIQLGGEPGVLLGHQAALSEIDDRLAELRARTRYETGQAS